tara:strand:+ start:939 stop:1175 length:237 start_codon:yes stop_codon:yes gene_type:complete
LALWWRWSSRKYVTELRRLDAIEWHFTDADEKDDDDDDDSVDFVVDDETRKRDEEERERKKEERERKREERMMEREKW